MEIKRGIDQNRIDEIIDWSFEFFKHVIPYGYFSALIKQETDLEDSFILTDENDKIFGIYLIGLQELHSVIGYDELYSNLMGVEGVLLAVDSSIRGNGWGNKLKDMPKTLGVDYIWGQQLKSLNNLNDWLKRRELIAETLNCYITAEIF